MTQAELEQEVRELLVRAESEHHKAFAGQDGEDPEWPIWYAGFLQKPLSEMLDRSFTRSQVVYCIMFVEFERMAKDPDAEWTRYYARHFAERFCLSMAPEKSRLVLYMFPMCPFCRRVQRTIDSLGIEVELRDIHADSRYRDELIEARGRSTVPVLRITEADGDRWMPESSDIVRHLERTYGKRKAG